MTERETKLAQSLIHDREGDKNQEVGEKELYKMSEKDDEYFKRMSDTEQMRLYTSLHDHNGKLRESIRSLKKELITVLVMIEEPGHKLSLKDLQAENKVLREELAALTMEKDKVLG